MTVQTSAGATLRISATQPVTFDEAGYEALFDASPAPALVGEITDMGEFGREYALVTHNPVGDRGTVKFKGSYNAGTMSLALGLDNDDAGQVLMQTASVSDDDYSFAVELQDGTRYFFQGKVMSWRVGIGSVDSVTTATATLELTSAGGVDVVGPVDAV